MQIKSKIIITVLSILLVLVTGYSIYLDQQTISKNNVKEREEILVAAMQKIDIPNEDIKEIFVPKTKTIVVVNKHNGTQFIYGWADENKSKVVVKPSSVLVE